MDGSHSNVGIATSKFQPLNFASIYTGWLNIGILNNSQIQCVIIIHITHIRLRYSIL